MFLEGGDEEEEGEEEGLAEAAAAKDEEMAAQGSSIVNEGGSEDRDEDDVNDGSGLSGGSGDNESESSDGESQSADNEMEEDDGTKRNSGIDFMVCMTLFWETTCAAYHIWRSHFVLWCHFDCFLLLCFSCSSPPSKSCYSNFLLSKAMDYLYLFSPFSLCLRPDVPNPRREPRGAALPGRVAAVPGWQRSHERSRRRQRRKRRRPRVWAGDVVRRARSSWLQFRPFHAQGSPS